MKIHYISCHEILEYDEIKLFTEMGYDVFSNGAYLDPKGHITLKRPGIPNMVYQQELAQIAAETSRTPLDDRLIDPFDTFIFMHSPIVLEANWHKIKHKNVILRMIGQSVAGIEMIVGTMRQEGLKVVRYSPKERNIPNYCGEDALIRFYKDENDFYEWNGQSNNVISFAQSLKGRRSFCHYDEIIAVIESTNGKVYGPGNEDLGIYNGGCVTYELQKQVLSDARAFIYGGTWPASYTLSFMEALMAGTPIVAISKTLAHLDSFEPIDFYEVDEILNEIGGIVCNSKEEMILATSRLLNDYSYAKEISIRQKELAIKYFGKQNIKQQWRNLLNGN